MLPWIEEIPHLMASETLPVAPHLTVVSDVMSDVTSKARQIFNKLQAQRSQ